MDRLEKIQGYVISQFLGGFGLEKINQFDSYGFDNIYHTIFLEVQKQYADFGEIDLMKLDTNSFLIASQIINDFDAMSFKLSSCIDEINAHAKEKRLFKIADSLKNGLIDPVEAIEKLSKINTVETQQLIDVSLMDYHTKKEVETIETGFYLYDEHVEDWKLGDLTIIFGRNGEGKTTFISQIIGHNLDKSVKTFLYSGEMSDSKIQNWLYRQIIGNRKDSHDKICGKYGVKYEIKKRIVDALKIWHKNTFYLYNRNSKRVKKEIEAFFNTMEKGAKMGIKLFIIDNLMAILEENADSLYSDQANFVQRCKDFATRNNVHVVLMAHPNKEKKEITGEIGNLEKTDISGSNNIPNKADNIIAIERVWCDERNCDLIVTSLKDRESGQRKVIKMLFSQETLRFYDSMTPIKVNYSWEKFLKPVEKTVKYYNGEEQTFKQGEI